jgi:plasmid stabilization system protein ParE
MKIVFLETTAQDIQWFRFYYRSVFPAGSAKARDTLRAIQATLAANPYAGHPSDARKTVREISIPRTPFVVVYRVTPTRIEVLRLWDSRQGTNY